MTMQRFEQSLESEQSGLNYQEEIANSQTRIDNIRGEREFEELNAKERAGILELMNQIETLQQKQLMEKKDREQRWIREMFIDWARDEVGKKDPETWIDKKIDFSDPFEPKAKDDYFRIPGSKSVKRVPMGLRGKILAAINCDLDTFPVDCEFESILVVGNGRITEIPNDLKKKRIDVSDTGVNSYPQSITCNELLMNGSTVDYIPTDKSTFRVKRLNLNKTSVTDIPQDADYEGLSLTFTDVEIIPDNFSIKVLNLSKSKVKVIPPDLNCEELHLSGTDVEVIPHGFECDELTLSDSKVKVITPDIEINFLDLDETDVRKIPDGLKCTSLSLDMTPVDTIPVGNTFIKDLFLSGSQVKKVPAGVRLDALRIGGCEIEEFSEDVKIGELWINEKIISDEIYGKILRLQKAGKIGEIILDHDTYERTNA
ncbi:hypothetical protein HN958_00380 [Candidatus Falkowbacteria bacterium]|jgi:hypothetical protein|nr:hypothetical protein [Candidatus Falkowbacteria bacterium]MBT7006945.1 hypothetical protein [Candidatus Falkowbacteria bacterium]